MNGRMERLRFIKITLYYYVTMVISIVLLPKFSPEGASLDSLIAVILLLYLLFFPLVFLYTYRYALHIFLFMLAFITGIYGFYYESLEPHSLLNALYFTFKLYLLDMTEVFTEDGASPTQYPFIIEISRWSAAAYTISTVFIAMYRSLEMRILLLRAQVFGNHYIIFGLNEKSFLLVEDLRANKETVIVIDEMMKPEEKQRLEEMKVLVLLAPVHEGNIFSKVAAQKAQSILLFHEKDRDSLYVLMELEEFTRRVTSKIKKVLIHLENYRYRRELTAFVKNMEHFSFPVVTMNVYEAMAEQFWKNHAKILEKPDKLHLLMVGYGELGQQLSLQAKQMGSEEKLAITVLEDRETESLQDGMTFIPFREEEMDLQRVIEKTGQAYSHIFICLEEDYVDLMEGIELSEIFPTTPIYMNFTDEMIEQTLHITHTKTARTLYSMGTKRAVLTQQFLEI